MANTPVASGCQVAASGCKMKTQNAHLLRAQWNPRLRTKSTVCECALVPGSSTQVIDELGIIAGQESWTSGGCSIEASGVCFCGLNGNATPACSSVGLQAFFQLFKKRLTYAYAAMPLVTTWTCTTKQLKPAAAAAAAAANAVKLSVPFVLLPSYLTSDPRIQTDAQNAIFYQLHL